MYPVMVVIPPPHHPLKALEIRNIVIIVSMLNKSSEKARMSEDIDIISTMYKIIDVLNTPTVLSMW
jgi:hypothetical protein